MESKQQLPDRMQNLAEEMFNQPTQEMTMLWAIEHRSQVKEPTF